MTDSSKIQHINSFNAVRRKFRSLTREQRRAVIKNLDGTKEKEMIDTIDAVKKTTENTKQWLTLKHNKQQ